ncbi:MAG: CHAT domain-containing protein [Roseiflexaceae bacterium]
MADDSSLDDLLSLCALLSWFDSEMLAALLPFDRHTINSFLTSAWIARAPDRAGAFVLRDDARAEVLLRLRTTRPLDELALHTRAFEHFLRRMTQADTPDRADAEISCFNHFARLFVLLFLRLEWQTISSYVARAAMAGPRAPHHLQRLALYEAFVAVRTGNYDHGAGMLEQLLAAPDLETEVRLNGLLAFGQMQRNLAHYDQALTTYGQLSALALAADNMVYHGVALINMGSVFNELQHFGRAIELVLQSLQIFEAHHDLERTAYAHYSAGLNAMYLGRYAFAREHFAAATRLFELLGMDTTIATCYWSQGYLQLLLGDEAASEAAYHQAIARAQSAQRGEPILAMDSWLELGFIRFMQGRNDEALAYYAEALNLAMRLHHDHRMSSIHFLRGRALQAQSHDQAALIAYQQALANIEALRTAHQSEDIKISVLGTTQQVYEATALLYLAQDRAEEAFHVVERARSRAFLDMLARKSPELYESFDQPVATLAEIQAQLPADALLIEYYTTGVLPAGEHLIHKLEETNVQLFRQLILAPRIVIFVLTCDGFEVREAQLDPNLFRPPPDEIRPGHRWLHERKLRALYDYLIGPVHDLLVGRRQVFLIPHGPLHHVPFLALRGPDGRYLLDQDGPIVALAPSATVLVRNCLARPQVAGGAFLALGYNDERVALRHAESEARAAARMMGGEAWTGSAPKSDSLMAVSMELRGLHVAGHAVYRPHDPLDSYLSLGLDDRLSARVIMHELNLRPGLVSLSACTSGLTQVVPGDEILGLLRAWLYAGATTVVCALWDAADIVARVMMERFYVALSAGASPGVAFRDAVVAVRQMTGRSLAETFARWRQEDEASARPGVLPEISPDQYDLHPYADAILWAPFMLIGRA